MTEESSKGTKMTKRKNWRQLRLSLKFRPKIYKLILKMRQIIRKRNSLIKSLKHKLQQGGNETPTRNTKDSATQTDHTESEKEKHVPISNVSSQADAGWNFSKENGDLEKSIAEQVKEVAQNALKETGMVYVESARMYYDYKTGYYYNSELGLYYHTDTNCYYFYSDEKQEFVFHSYPDTSAINTSLIAHQKKKARKAKKNRKQDDQIENLTNNLAQDNKPKRKRKKKNQPSDDENKDQGESTGNKPKRKRIKKVELTLNDDKDQNKLAELSENENKDGNEMTNVDSKQIENKPAVVEELEDGECSDSDSDSEASDANESSDSESDASTSTVSDEDIVAKHHPPCMRIIVRETNLPKLKVGSLFLITKDGGTVGREGDQHTILIKDHNVSRNHLDIRYDPVKKTYTATDLGSKNGTILNGSRMSESQEISSQMQILHGSTIQLGETKLLCHIHPGNDTCGHCEPGLLMETEEKEKKAAYTRTCSVQKQHQLELARLKNIYAPKLLEIEEKPYNDRAQARRDTVGSMNHAEKTQSSDLDTCISQENKGFKLLQKMGWSKGEGLGKDSQGDTEPVPLISNEGKAGLGTSGASAPPPAVPKPRVTNTIASATMRLASRTKMLQPPAKAFQGADDEESE